MFGDISRDQWNKIHLNPRESPYEFPRPIVLSDDECDIISLMLIGNTIVGLVTIGTPGPGY